MTPVGHQLEKWVWTDADFEKMGWHDTTVHGLGFVNEFPERFELLFDIDYIVEWVHPKEKGGLFRFWVAPATLVFDNVNQLAMSIGSWQMEFEILELEREDEQVTQSGAKHWLWSVEMPLPMHLSLPRGKIEFRSTGFKQFFRREPSLSDSQRLSFASRGGISFDRRTPDG